MDTVIKFVYIYVYRYIVTYFYDILAEIETTTVDDSNIVTANHELVRCVQFSMYMNMHPLFRFCPMK